VLEGAIVGADMEQAQAAAWRQAYTRARADAQRRWENDAIVMAARHPERDYGLATFTMKVCYRFAVHLLRHVPDSQANDVVDPVLALHRLEEPDGRRWFDAWHRADTYQRHDARADGLQAWDVALAMATGQAVARERSDIDNAWADFDADMAALSGVRLAADALPQDVRADIALAEACGKAAEAGARRDVVDLIHATAMARGWERARMVGRLHYRADTHTLHRQIGAKASYAYQRELLVDALYADPRAD